MGGGGFAVVFPGGLSKEGMPCLFLLLVLLLFLAFQKNGAGPAARTFGMDSKPSTCVFAPLAKKQTNV